MPHRSVYFCIHSRKLRPDEKQLSGTPQQNQCNTASLNLQRCQMRDSIGLFARNFGLLIQKKSPNDMYLALKHA